MAPGQRWCRHGFEQARCVRYHARDKLPPVRPKSGNDRECPVDGCGSNLSLNPGSKGMWLVWCCGGGCPPEIVRAALVGIIDLECLGSYGSDAWLARQERKVAAAYPSNRADSATYAAAARSYAMHKLAGSNLGNASLLKMCLQAIHESDGSHSGDPAALLPRDFGEFIALAERTGIERCHRYKLARSYLSK